MTITEMPERERPLSEQFRIVARQWVDEHSAFNMLDKLKNETFAKMVREYIQSSDENMAYNRAEMHVRASDDWMQYKKDLVSHENAAAKLKVQMEFIRMRFSEWQSLNANARQERQLSR